MNGPERVVRNVDAFQQRTGPIAFVFAIVKKFGDDKGGSLAALMAYYGFLALFPAFLLLTTILGFALRNNPSLQNRVVDSALGDFPIVGDEIRTNIHSLQASGLGLAIGIIGLVWGSLAVTQAAQYAMAQVWNVKGKDRPNFFSRVTRGVLFIGAMGVGVTATTLQAEIGALDGTRSAWIRVASYVVTLAANVGLYVVAFRILTPKEIPRRDLVPGAVLGGVGWTVLQFGGTYLVAHQLRGSSQVYGFFAIVLGLMWWLYLGAQLSLYAAELNVVLARRLWPRSIVQPPLTPSDRDVLRDIAEQATVRPEQHIEVTFSDPAESDASP